MTFVKKHRLELIAAVVDLHVHHHDGLNHVISKSLLSGLPG